jgi:hypothetical protein
VFIDVMGMATLRVEESADYPIVSKKIKRGSPIVGF